jgi:site-specific DNA recombinase
MQHKIGIYVRVSSEEQAQVVDGSIDSQQHRIRGFVDIKLLQEKSWGKIIDTYIDDGYSAKNTNRPAYQRMMKDIRNGKIDLILLTDLSRLSRSIADFCLLIKELEKYKAKFLSIKEQFDTSTPAGEMMVFNMINLAQFERRQTSERIAMNFHSRALRGLVNGGNPILGFDKNPTNPGKLIVNDQEAALVKMIFESYLDAGSISTTVKKLNTLKIPRKNWQSRKFRHISDGRWTVGALKILLRNIAYIGKREINKAHKNESPHHLKAWQQHQIVEASWPAIIDHKLFESVQKALDYAKEGERNRLDGAERRIFLVTGLLRCKTCGKALFGQAAHGTNRVIRYYGHKQATGDPITCPIKRFSADEIEDAIIRHLGEVVLKVGYLEKIEANIQKMTGENSSGVKALHTQRLKDLQKVEAEIDSIFRLMVTLPETSASNTIVKEKLQNLSEKKLHLTEAIADTVARIGAEISASAAKSVIQDRGSEFKRGFKKATPSNQKRLIRNVFDQLVFGEDGLSLFYDITSDGENPGSDSIKKGTLGLTPRVPDFLTRFPFSLLAGSHSDESLRVGLLGGAGRNGYQLFYT